MVEAYSNLSGIYNTLGQHDKSIEYAEKALEIKPDFSEAINNMAIAYYHKKDIKKAIELMEKAVKLNPKNPTAVNNLQVLKGLAK